MPLLPFFNRYNKVHPIKNDEEAVSTTKKLQKKGKLQHPPETSTRSWFFDNTFSKCLFRKKKKTPTEERVAAVSTAERSAAFSQTPEGTEKRKRNSSVYLVQREQAKQKSNVEEKKKAAALSLSTAEELKAKKKSRSSQFKNYILKGRPITLSTLPKQSQNIQELKEQEHKQSCLKEKRNARLQQVQLAEELARQKVRELKMKKENDKKHQKTLDHQPELPHPRVPTRRPVYNGSVVGVRPVTTTGVRAEVKQKVQRIHSENLKPVKTVKKYEVPSVKLTEQNKETETLQPNLMGFTAEQLAGLKLQSWQYDAKMRLIRDPEEEAFIRFSDELLLEQSQKYRSCYQRLIDSNIKN